MRYLSVCAGIEAATVAWHPLGWTPAAFSEIEAFPRAVLAHHYPTVPLHGDFTTIKGDQDTLIAFDTTQITSRENRSQPRAGDKGHPLAAGAHPPTIAHAFDARQSDVIQYGDKTGPLDTDGYSMGVGVGVGVRRLTPRECERLQGFPDDYTLVPFRKKPAADGPRYRALGNSMAVPVMRWIGERIAMVEALGAEAVAA